MKDVRYNRVSTRASDKERHAENILNELTLGLFPQTMSRDKRCFLELSI